MKHIIGLLGTKGAGKDTAAATLVTEFGFTRIAFADALYQEVSEAFGVPVELLGNRWVKEDPISALALARCKDPHFVEVALQVLGAKYRGKRIMNDPRSARWTLQLWGTEYRRKSRFGVNTYWLDIVDAKLAQVERAVITDTRFKNEADFLRSKGDARLARVVRESVDQEAARLRAAGDPAANHPSETEMLGYPVDYVLENRENEPEALADAIRAMMAAEEHKFAA